jgi:hypothetical protein
MPKIRRTGAVIALLVALAMSSPAFASPRGDDGDFGGLMSRVRRVIARVITALDDVRVSIPP